jgi:YggT family protein
MRVIVELIVNVLWLAILGRVLLSWFPEMNRNNPIVVIIYQVSEPILSPLRRVVPRMGSFDLTPMIAIILLWLISSILLSAV